ncbi:hypothetical protein pv_245 [Pithovirus sibericum]|uniref:Uncharacterized protein n=1 Tax=Pithovirus sibericum TaxID=1450746 RepID=W5S659_9VIRU|nr:hypothetical protein pv_245 [Pithovirus sibericum]AHH01812.1 hypothetical protein pv_245 [Pithovirus sibericum]
MFQPPSLRNLVLLDQPYFQVRELCKDERFYSLCDENLWALKAERDLGIPTEYFALANQPLQGRNPLPSRELTGYQRYLELLTKKFITPDSRANFNKRTQKVGGIYESYGGLLESIERGSVPGVEFFFPLISQVARQDLESKIVNHTLAPYRYRFWAFFRTLQLLFGDDKAQQIAQDSNYYSYRRLGSWSDFFEESVSPFPPSQIDLWVEEGNLQALGEAIPQGGNDLWGGLVYLVRLGSIEAAHLCLEFLNLDSNSSSQIHREVIISSLTSGNVEIVNLLLPFWSVTELFLPIGNISDVRQIPQLPPGTFNNPIYRDNIFNAIQYSYYGCNQELIDIFLTTLPTDRQILNPRNSFADEIVEGMIFHRRFADGYSILKNLFESGSRGLVIDYSVLRSEDVDAIRLVYSDLYNESAIREKIDNCRGNVNLLVNLFMILRENHPDKVPSYLLKFLKGLPKYYSKLYPLSEKICQIEYERFSQQ